MSSPASATAALTRALTSTPAGSFPFSEQSAFVTVPASTTVAAAFTALLDNRITSAPVYDDATKAWLGFVDLGDCAKYLCASRVCARGLRCSDCVG
jgi:predicted transcriptional regulator